MPRDASGNYTLVAGNPVTPLTPIESTWANSTLDDIATALTGSLSRSGLGGMLGPLELITGTAGVPALIFNDADTGLYGGLGQINFTVNGEKTVDITAAGLRSYADLQVKDTIGNVQSDINLDCPDAATTAALNFRTEASITRWNWQYENTTNVLSLQRRDAAGVLVGSTLTVDPATGNATFEAQVRTAAVPAGATDLTNKTYVDGIGTTSAPPGAIIDYAAASAPTGWLLCDGSAVSRATYAALFAAIGVVWGAGDGSTTFNVPDLRGRMTIGQGSGSTVAAGVDADVDITNDTFTVASNADTWITGMQVAIAYSSGSVTGLAAGTYYVVRNNATTIKFATSLANARAGNVVNMTAKSSPVWTVTYSLTARTIGVKGGEEGHLNVLAEIPSHTHFYFTGGGSNGATSSGTAFNINTSAAGGDTAHNNMNPLAVVNKIIKT